jgi:hypothetical protein
MQVVVVVAQIILLDQVGLVVVGTVEVKVFLELLVLMDWVEVVAVALIQEVQAS